MAKAKKENHKPKSRKSVKKNQARIKKNHEIINRILKEVKNEN